jgi:serine/threonine protein kinase
MEFMDNGDLFSFINANKKLGKKISEDKVWHICEQCLKGLVYIHSLRLIHRDIKPANLLLNSKGEIKLIDFNLSALENNQKVNANRFTSDELQKRKLVSQNTQIELGNFQAPEVGSSYDCKIDVYSMGIIFCFLVFYKAELPLDPYNNLYYSKELIDIIVKMTDSDPNKRPSSLEIYNKFLKEYHKKFLHVTGLLSCINCISLYDTFNDCFKGKHMDDTKNEIASHLDGIMNALIKKNKEEEEFSLFSNNNYGQEDIFQLLSFDSPILPVYHQAQ